MDRRFFENDNVEDLSKNESQESFQKIEEENEVLKENYMWSDEEDYFLSETGLKVEEDKSKAYESKEVESESTSSESYNLSLIHI